MDATPDYKKLWEDSQVEREQLVLEMEAMREELQLTKMRLEEALLVPCYSAALLSPSMGSAERGERQEARALQHQLERMDDDLEELQSLREENETLRTENRSLTFFISKMAASCGRSTRV